jgi:hypothetical protein
MRSKLMNVAVIMFLFLIVPGVLVAQTCQKCTGTGQNQWCVSTYQPGSNDCIANGYSCTPFGGACTGGDPHFLTPDGSNSVAGLTHLMRAATSGQFAVFQVTTSSNARVRVERTASGITLIDCKRRIVGRVQTPARIDQVRRLTQAISL